MCVCVCTCACAFVHTLNLNAGEENNINFEPRMSTIIPTHRNVAYSHTISQIVRLDYSLSPSVELL